MWKTSGVNMKYIALIMLIYIEVWIQDWTPNLGTFRLSFHGHAKVCYILGLIIMVYTNDRLHSTNFISSPKLTLGFRVCLRFQEYLSRP